MTHPEIAGTGGRLDPIDESQNSWYTSAFPLPSQSPSLISVKIEETFLPMDVWQQLCTVAPCGLVLLDSHTVVRFLNTKAAALLGLQPEVVIGQVLIEVLPGWKDTIFSASLPSLISAQTTFESIDFEVPGVSETRLRLTAAFVSNGTAESRGVLLSLVECTDVTTLEQRLHRAEYQASIGKLARGIAHELNSPLDGVLRYTHLALEQLTEDSSVREYLVHVKEGLDRMVRAVRAFLEFSRQVSTPVNRVADLNQLIDDALLLVQHRAKFQRIQMVKRYGEVLPAVLDGGIQHAVVNLVKNAFDAMPRGGTLTITTRLLGSMVEIEVEDTGTGISESIRPRIYEPFFSTKPIHQGSGLGLVIAREVVERAGGSIDFTSQEGVGTSFRIQIPVANTEERHDGTESHSCR